MPEHERQPSVPNKEKMLLLANECIGLPVQRYIPEHEGIFHEEKFNGCLAFVKFILIGAGIPIPNFIGPDRIERPMAHVNEFFDHFGVSVPYNKQQAGDLVFFSWDGVRPLHIGVVANENEYIHAYTKGGLVQKNKLNTYPIKTNSSDPIYVNNPIGFKRPTVSNLDTRWFQRPI